MNIIKNNTKKMRYLPWIVWILSALFYFYEFLLQVSPNIMASDLMRDFKINGTTLGYFGAIYFWAYAAMQIPVGLLLDHFGSRKSLTIASFVCALGCFGFYFAPTIHYAELSRMFMGFGSAFAAVGCLNLAARWFPTKYFALLTGLMISIGMLGAACGEAPLALYVNKFGWLAAMITLGWIGLIISLLIAIIIRDRPDWTKPLQPHHKPRLREGLKYVICNKQSWIIALYGGLMFAPTPILGALWGAVFIQQVHQVSHEMAAALTACIFIGWIIGGPFFGGLSDRLRRRKVSMYIGSCGALITILSFIYIPHQSIPVLIILLIAFGFFSSGFATSFSTIREISPAKYSATSLGFMNMMNMIGAATAQPIIGIILDHYWSGKFIHGARAYSTAHFQLALTSIPLMIGLSLLLLPFIKETFCKEFE